MKLGSTLFFANILCFATMTASAQSYNGNQDQQNSSQSNEKLLQAVTNWAAYLGYDVSSQKAPNPPSTELTDYANASWMELVLYTTYFGSIPVTPSSTSSSSSSTNQSRNGPFVPQDEPGASKINARANLIFKNFASPGQGTDLTVNPLIDQPSSGQGTDQTATNQAQYQPDPVSQSLMNILGTPDVSYCRTADGKVPKATPLAMSTCTYLTSSPKSINQNQVTINVIGKIPNQNDFFTSAANIDILPQLNSNSLIGPLAYDTQQQSQTEQSTGLTANNQLQQAANFIRYVSGSVNPTLLPSYSAYQAVYSQTKDTDHPTEQAQAEAILSSYLTNLRTYAAQSSVGLGNLYYILSKRIPQQLQSAGQAQGSGASGGGFSNISAPSQALNEYNMATWRLYNPAATTGTSSNQWIDKINKGSPATVQKEIAILLSEINYQLFLNRQIEERMLLTSSVSLLQGAKASQPSSDLTNQNTSASTSTSSNSKPNS